jgi:hypothetical protein
MTRIFLFSLSLFGVCALGAQVGCPITPDSMHANRLFLRNIGLGGWLGNERASGLKHTLAADFDAWHTRNAGIGLHALWLSAKDQDGLLRVAGYSAHGGIDTTNFRYLSGPSGAGNCSDWGRFWRVDRKDLEEHFTDLVDGVLNNPNPQILAWPGNGNPHFLAIHGFPLPQREFAPFYDANQDGVYDPYSGDYPHPHGVSASVEVGTMLWEIFHGTDTVFQHGMQAPPFEIHRTIWAMECAGDSPLNYSFFSQWAIRNASTETWNDVRAGIWLDWVLGESLYDYFGTNRAIDAIFAYHTSEDRSYPTRKPQMDFGVHPPAAAIAALNRPLDGSVYYYSWIGVCTQHASKIYPVYPTDYDNLMHNLWRSGEPLIRKHDGFTLPPIDSSLITSFIFDGDPRIPNSWSASNFNFVCPPGITNQVMNFDLKDLQPDETERIDLVFNFYRDTTSTPIGQLDGLFSGVTQIRDAWQQGLDLPCTPVSACIEPDCVWPGDANHNGKVDVFDVHPMDIQKNKSGPARTTPLLWRGHTVSDWAHISNNVNAKHADVNGNGLIDSFDLHTLTYYYAKTHGQYVPSQQVIPAGTDIELVPVFSQTADSIGFNRFFLFQIKCNNPNVYRLAVEIEFDTAALRNHLGPLSSPDYTINDTSIQFYRRKIDGFDIAFGIKNTPITLSNRLQLRTRDIPGLTQIHITKLEAYDQFDKPISLTANPLSLCIGGGCTSQTQELETRKLTVMPNPFHDGFSVEGLAESEMYQFTLMDLLGKVWAEKICFGESAQINQLSFPSGLYVLRLRQISTGAQRTVLVVGAN